MSAALNTRPRPIFDAFKSVGSAVALVSSVVTSAAGWGILTAAEADASVALLGAIPGVVTLVGALLAAFGVVKRSEKDVTPIIDPAVQLIPGGRLVPLVPAQD